MVGRAKCQQLRSGSVGLGRGAQEESGERGDSARGSRAAQELPFPLMLPHTGHSEVLGRAPTNYNSSADKMQARRFLSCKTNN